MLQDAFGNYVVQYVLELGHAEAALAVMSHIAGRCAELSQQKFSSNVVEKCLKLNNPGLAEAREGIVLELIQAPNLARLLQVAVNAFSLTASDIQFWDYQLACSTCGGTLQETCVSSTFRVACCRCCICACRKKACRRHCCF